ncbi:MAG: oligoribonuclease [Gammaproteobacteria bacterium]|nr:oligoribonuclease [Gammaproteobacteria bacterium]
MTKKLSKNLVWLDLEMTGLEVETDLIIEMATIVTDSHLNVLAEGPVFAIYQSDDCLANMGEWVTKTHTKSGLVERVRASTITEAEAEQQTIEFLAQYVKAGASPLCGNSICMDRRFLARYMPKLCDFFHYRHIDVSTIKELAKRWRPELKSFAKDGGHQALADIRESIEELKYYRECFFKT